MIVDSYDMSFSGMVLERGFWLYVWRIDCNDKLFFYVGRTGDSSSPYASSPFNRIGQHLDFRPNAKGNSLAKRLNEAGVNPKDSEFQMLAMGPFFEEQDNFEQHKPKRDFMATLEVEAAEHLKSLGYTVLGKHHRGCLVPAETIVAIKSKISEFSTKIC